MVKANGENLDMVRNNAVEQKINVVAWNDHGAFGDLDRRFPKRSNAETELILFVSHHETGRRRQSLDVHDRPDVNVGVEEEPQGSMSRRKDRPIVEQRCDLVIRLFRVPIVGKPYLAFRGVEESRAGKPRNLAGQMMDEMQRRFAYPRDLNRLAAISGFGKFSHVAFGILQVDLHTFSVVLCRCQVKDKWANSVESARLCCGCLRLRAKRYPL
jgi:hypothetical protein